MMKTKLCIFLLAASLAAYGQGRSGGGAGRMGGPPSGGRAGAGSTMGGAHGTMGGSSRGSDAGMARNTTRSRDMGKQSPDMILSRNTQLNSKLQPLLPSGMTPQQACSGFRNLGQCVAAIHVSHNLGVSFDDLKAKTTGPDSQSLGKAIHDLKPEVNAKAEAKKAEKQAKRDLAEPSS